MEMKGSFDVVLVVFLYMYISVDQIYFKRSYAIKKKHKMPHMP